MQRLQLSLFEATFVWLVALGGCGLAIGALLQSGMGGKRLSIALLFVAFSYMLVTRSLVAVMLTVVAAALVTLFGVLMVADGAASTGMALGIVGAVVTGVLGRAVLRELEWPSPPGQHDLEP